MGWEQKKWETSTGRWDHKGWNDSDEKRELKKWESKRREWARETMDEWDRDRWEKIDRDFHIKGLTGGFAGRI